MDRSRELEREPVTAPEPVAAPEPATLPVDHDRQRMSLLARLLAPLAVLVGVLVKFGAFALKNTVVNVYVLAVFGVLGYVMVKTGFPLAPFILGVILGDQIEINLIRAIMSDPDPWLFVTRPISGVLLAMSVASVVAALWQHRRHQRRAAAPAEDDADF